MVLPAEALGMIGVTLPLLQILEGRLRGDSCHKVKLTLEEDTLGSDFSTSQASRHVTARVYPPKSLM